jgi:EmrB/QacA subfamily drug resistance transporter
MAITEEQRTRNETVERDEQRHEQKYRRRWAILAILSVSLLVIIVDDTIVNVAIPTLQRELGASTTALQWVVDAYILAFAGLLLTMGTLGDRFGRKRFLQLGLVVFAAASVFGAYSASASQLIAARALMGVGGALIMPSTLSVLIDVFPRGERVKAIGIWTGVASLGIPIGPIVGGWLLEHFWWGSAFLLNVPIAAGALAAGWMLIPESRHPAPPRPDLPGLALSVVALTSLVYGIIEAPSHGWTSATVLGSLGLAIVSGAAFVALERRARQPMLDLRLFRNPRLGWGTAAIGLAFLALSGLTFELTQYLQFVQQYSPLQAGLRVLPIALGFGIAGPLSQRVVPRIGTARPVAGALGLVALVLVGLSSLDPGTSYWLLAPALFLFGLGLGTALVPSTDAVMAAVPQANAGLGSAINDAGRQIGAALGIGVLGALANAGYTSGIADALSPLGPSGAAVAERSVGAALHIANGLGGSTGESLRRAADAAFMDGFASAMLGGAALLAAGAVMVLRWLPSNDVRAGSEPAPEQPPIERRTAEASLMVRPTMCRVLSATRSIRLRRTWVLSIPSRHKGVRRDEARPDPATPCPT